ncbi:interleukin-22 receptor subunit alpha-1 isoform X2 [Numida meleagris]|uniref:interleukin-22 receptor subunit alpha-1 isoform X2 n=1 Tax=Numida meleagris TaxID=8996 RepID=UPI000B3DAE37|nr:interleukin-22 receptor subunit alpha-1 isoform X2 [Numida meleagris]
MKKLLVVLAVCSVVAIIGAPEVKYIPHVRSIKFLIRPPYTPLRGEDGHQLTIEDIYSKFGAVDYHLTIFNQRTQQKWIKNEHNKEFEVSNLDPDTEYNGTVHLYLLERSSKSQVFGVKTLPDNTWLFYCFVGLGFCAGLVFAAIGYVIYKYVKQNSAQPMSLDFRGISSFQPLTLTVEHIIKPINLSKPSLLIPEAQFPQVGLCLDKALEPPQPFHPSSSTYQQQANLPVFQGAHLLCSVSTAPAGYAPQTSEQSIANLSMTYGVCVNGIDCSNKSNLRPNQLLKEVSSDSSAGGKFVSHMLGESCSHWNYKEQQPNVALWDRGAMRESALIHGSPEQIQKLLLRTDGVESEEHLPQLLLPLVEQGGCYRQQTAELPLLLSSVTVDTDCVPEDESLSRPTAAHLLSVSTGNNFPGENTEWCMSPDAVSYSENKVRFQETWEAEKLPAAQELNCMKVDNVLCQDTISEYHNGISLTTLFKDLNLKVLWDQADENTEFY